MTNINDVTLATLHTTDISADNVKIQGEDLSSYIFKHSTGSKVTVTPELMEGVKIATISVDSDIKNIYAPEEKNRDCIGTHDVKLNDSNSVVSANFRVGCYCKEKNITIMSSKSKGLFWTEDGINYTQCQADSSVAEERKTFIEATGSFETAIWDGEKFIVTGDSGIWYSEDGKTWKSTSITTSKDELVYFRDDSDPSNIKHYYACGPFVTMDRNPENWVWTTNILQNSQNSGQFINGRYIYPAGSKDVNIEGSPFTSLGVWAIIPHEGSANTYERLQYDQELIDYGMDTKDFAQSVRYVDTLSRGEVIVGGVKTTTVLIPLFGNRDDGLLYTTDGLIVHRVKGSKWTRVIASKPDCSYETPAITKEGYIICGSNASAVQIQNPPYMVWKDITQDPVDVYLDGVKLEKKVYGYFMTTPKFCEETQCWYGCAYKSYSQPILYSKDAIHWFSTDSVGKFTGPTILNGKLIFAQQGNDGNIKYSKIPDDFIKFIDTMEFMSGYVSKVRLNSVLNGLSESSTTWELIQALKNI